MRTRNRFGAHGFSLLEVLIALGVFSGAILVIVGLSAPLQRRVADIVDAEAATSLVKNIEGELRRIGYSDLMDSPLLPRLSPTAENPLVLFATSDGSRVLIDVDADNSLTAGVPRGMAERDRYFRIRVVEQVTPDVAAGWLALRTDVSWPFRVPLGPETPDVVSVSHDASEVLPEGQRTGMSYFFALTP